MVLTQKRKAAAFNLVRAFSGKDGVQIGAVTSIQCKGTKIWIGDEFGLESLNGSRFQPVMSSDGDISGIVVDSKDGLWEIAMKIPRLDRPSAADRHRSHEETVIITGASQGIGAALVRAFLKRGYNAR